MQPDAQARGVRSAQDIDLVRAVLLPRAALCLECISRKASLARARTEEALMRMSAVDVVTTVARCDACLKEAVVHRLATQLGPSRAASA